METKKIYIVTIAKFDGNQNYLDADTEVYAAESDAKERVDELTEKFSNQSDIDDSGELDGVHGSVFYFLDEHIVKVWYDEKEVFMTFKAQCERNLTDAGYKEVMQGVEL